MFSKGPLPKRKINQEPKITQKAMLILNGNSTNDVKQIIPNRYYSQFQHTFTDFQRQSTQKQKQHNSDNEILALKYQINRLMQIYTQLDTQIDENAMNQKEQQVQEMLLIQDQSLVNLCNTSKSQFDLQIQINSNSEDPIIELENQSKLNNLELTFKHLIQEKQFLLNQLNKDREELCNNYSTLHQQLKQINQQIAELQNSLEIQQNQNRLLEKEKNYKHLQLNIIQEQFILYRHYSKVICVFTCKQKQYDQNFTQYFKVQDQKCIEIISKSKEYCNSDAKNIKAKIPQRDQFQYDFVVRKQTNNVYNIEEEVFKETNVFLTSLYYKQIDQIYKSYSFNSDEYNTIFNNDFKNNIHTRKLVSILNKQSNDKVKNGIIFVISRKFTDFVNKYLERIIQHFLSFKNKISYVIDLICHQRILNIKDDLYNNVQSFKFEDYKQKIKDISFQVEENEITHIEIQLVFSNGMSRSLHIICINIQTILNVEQFSRQLKSAFNKEKSVKECLSQQLENLIKNSDKRLIIAEVPEYIKKTFKSKQILEEIKNVFEFTSKFSQKKI